MAGILPSQLRQACETALKRLADLNREMGRASTANISNEKMLRRALILTAHLLLVSRILIVSQDSRNKTESTETTEEIIEATEEATETEETDIENKTNKNSNSSVSQSSHTNNELLALLPQGSGIEFIGDIAVVPALKGIEIVLFGDIGNNTIVVFTRTESNKNAICDLFDRTRAFEPRKITDGVYSLTATFREFNTKYHICVRQFDQWKHQGEDLYLIMQTVAKPHPIIFKIILIVIMLFFSALFSGLNIGLMTLDTNDLQVLATKGNDDQMRYAQTILPVRRRGNFLLCSLLLGNVMVNSILTITLDSITSGFVAVICSSALIVLIGEIIPQAICSRHGLIVGAKTIYFTYLLMFVTFPIAYPVSVVLECLLGKEIGHIYDRERLKAYIQITRPYNKLDEDEITIITGVLELTKKTVGDVMTKLADIYMLPIGTKIGTETISDIRAHGFSRIPVYDKQRSNVVGLLFVKDLIVFANEADVTVEKVVKTQQYPLIFTKKNERLKPVMEQFKRFKCHMALVKDTDNSDGIIGLITMEDIHEEILKTEINDESDIISDNKTKEMRKAAQMRADFGTFLNVGEGRSVDTRYVSPQLFYAVFKFLAVEVKPFTADFVSRTVLRRLAELKVYFDDKGVETTVYSIGAPADFFVIIFDGRASLFIGKEQLQFECRCFNYFGVAALDMNKEHLKQVETSSLDKLNVKTLFIKPKITADFTLKVPDSCLYMKITRRMYLAAVKATFMEKQWIKNKKDVIKEIDNMFAKTIDAKSLGKLWVRTHKLKSTVTRSPSKSSTSSTTSKGSVKTSKK